MTQAADTRERLLDAAERLFAEQGMAGASLRRITSEAGANLAAVNYHFGSKLELVRAVIERRLEPINAERLERLDALEARPEGPDLRSLLRAFLAPALNLGLREGREFFVFIARAHTNPSPELRALVKDQFRVVAARYSAGFHACLPQLDMQQLMWRVHFVIGSLCHTVLNTALLEEVTEGLCRGDDERVLDRLVDFAVGGLSGPVEDAG